MSSDVPSQDPSRFFCHCGKSFIRKEHLRRHESSHAKPAFVCQVCQKSFTRNDLLRRHVALHGSKGTPAPRRSKACNACHESKVKCDGGERCSLCVKRGIECLYDRDMKSEPAAVAQDGHPDQSTAPSTDRAEGLQSDRDEAEYGLRTIMSLLESGPKLPTRVGLPVELSEVNDWWQRCSDTYRLEFHNHWTILHYPTIQDFPRHDVWLEAAIAMVAMWATHEPRSDVRKITLDIHEHLMASFLRDLAANAADLDAQSRHWPWHMWCVALINVVFAMEIGDMAIIRRADHLFDMVLRDCQRRRAFDPESIRQHQKIHEPGDFQPWVFKNTEQFHKMAAVVLKIDTCLSLVADRAPRLRGEQLGSRLPAPFTFWNAFGLGQHFERHPHQPRALEQYSIAQLSRISHVDIPLFFEDVQLLLCGALQSTRTLIQAQRCITQTDPATECQQQAIIAGKLKLYHNELRRLRRGSSKGANDPGSRRKLMWIYTGKEESEDPGWQKTVELRLVSIERHTSLIESLAGMNLFADVQMLGARMTQAQTDAPESMQESARVFAWAGSSNGRMALLHAMAALIHFQQGLPDQPIYTDIVSALAMTTASIILYSWFGCIPYDNDSNGWGSAQPNISLDYIRQRTGDQPPDDVMHWVKSGGSVAAIDGWQLGRKLYSQHMASVLAKLKPVRDTWPLCEPFSAALEAQI